MPLFGMIGMVLLMHYMYGHIGKHKLCYVMKGTIFHPCMNRVCIDVATTCIICQLWKEQSLPFKPPILKIDAQEPWEMVVVDLVNLPRTKTGFIGLVVVVDNKSKFVMASPILNKTSIHISEEVNKNIFPMMMAKPQMLK